MNRINVLFVCLVVALSVNAQPTLDNLQPLQVDVVYLSSDLLGGRETGTIQEKMAANYIANRFEESGLSPKGTEGWFQPFEFDYKPNPHGPAEERRIGMNVVGYLDNGAANTVIIGGHYDHLGMGHFGSRHTGDPAIHNGADDNASGIAALFRIAEELQQPGYQNNNYLFLAFSGEELGLYGSKYYVSNPTVDLQAVNYMINLDMVGRLNDEGMLVINGAGTSPVWKEVLPEIKSGNISIKTTDSGIGPSDHTSFYLEDIPVLHFFTGQHADYHKPEDDSELVNFEGLFHITNYIVGLIGALDDDGQLEFTKTKDESQDRKVSDFKVTLGVMPDYVFDGTGMRIDGVLSDRPAENAGLQKGDIIIRIGDTEVADIFGYMEGLSNYESGDKATVVVKRGDEILEFEVQF